MVCTVQLWQWCSSDMSKRQGVSDRKHARLIYVQPKLDFACERCALAVDNPYFMLPDCNEQSSTLRKADCGCCVLRCSQQSQVPKKDWFGNEVITRCSKCGTLCGTRNFKRCTCKSTACVWQPLSGNTIICTDTDFFTHLKVSKVFWSLFQIQTQQFASKFTYTARPHQW